MPDICISVRGGAPYVVVNTLTDQGRTWMREAFGSELPQRICNEELGDIEDLIYDARLSLDRT